MLNPSARPFPGMIPQAPVPPGYALRDVQLEMSLKPFWDGSEATARAVAHELFTQWSPLTRYAETISVLLWVGDGSEILEFTGKPEQELEWGRYIGSANPHIWRRVMTKRRQVPEQKDHAGIGQDINERDPDRRDPHSRSYLYRPEPARFTFGWLAELVAILKEVGESVTGKPILVGETFDIGPEFAVSRFKYDWHREILGTGVLFGGQFISCEAVLEPDTRKYAGYPDGIPAGITIGRFLGRQSRHLFEQCGFDFLWLSNGFGFGLEPWSLVGQVFDGQRFYAERAGEVADRIRGFWRDLREEFPPSYRIRTRGTNFGTGTDLASDAVPMRDIYSESMGVDAPVNSPWAALNDDYGVELVGWMARVAQRPGAGYRFRYYIHDPWWMNSPWLDRYERSPHDIFLAGAVSRLRADGSAEPPSDLALLSVDDSHGRLPPQVPNEVIPALLRVRELQPDAAGPFIWVYPFDDNHELVFGPKPDPARPFFADWFARGLIAEGMPLNQVADAGAFSECVAAGRLASGVVAVSPVPVPGSVHESGVLAHIEAGGSVLLYGPLFPGSPITESLGLDIAESMEGDFDLSGALAPHEGPGRIRHTNTFSGGGWCEVSAARSDPQNHVLATGTRDGSERIAAVVHTAHSGGRCAWLRGSITSAEFDPEDPGPISGPLLQPLSRTDFFTCERLAVRLLTRLGWEIGTTCDDPETCTPFLVAHRQCNGFVFAGYRPDPAAVQRLRTPLGAPLLDGSWNRLSNGALQLPSERSWQHACRFFVDGQGEGDVRTRILFPAVPGVNCRRLLMGLDSATVRFFPEPGMEDSIRILRNSDHPYYVGETVEPVVEETPWGRCITVNDATGELFFEW